MNAEAIHEYLQKTMRHQLAAADLTAIDPWIEVKPEGVSDVCRLLRDEDALSFDMLHCITAVDYFEPDAKKAAQVEWQPHLQLIYHLSSFHRRHRIVLKTRLPRWRNDKPGELPEVTSVSDLWSTAEWHEREVFDLMGVYFVGNRDLRRILCPEDWPGHPLRKDFVMASEYHGLPTR